MCKKPLISIITVVYNGENFLEKTIQSVINQTYKNIEYIIIDGGSTDGTVNIIKRYEDQIDYWVSERDGGIYDAMNKGIDKANGVGLLFLNAGDYFVGEVLNSKISIPTFLSVKYKNRFGKLVDAKIKNYKYGIPNSHQGIIFENRGVKYNLLFKIASDYDYFLRLGYDDKLPILNSSGYVYYDNIGLSSMNYKRRDEEVLKIIKEHFTYKEVFIFYVKSKIKSFIKGLIT